MKITLIVLACLAVVLGVIAYFAVFSGTQVIEPVATSTTNQQSSTPTMVLTAPSSSASTSATIALSSSTATATSPTSQDTAPYATAYAAPYPVTWTEGETKLAITSANLIGNQLTFSIAIQLGADVQCVPINLRMVTDEAGDMAAPTSPMNANFPLAPDGGCNVPANSQYASNVSFTVDPTALPILITVGPPSNTFFEVSTTTGNGLQVAIPQQSG